MSIAVDTGNSTARIWRKVDLSTRSVALILTTGIVSYLVLVPLIMADWLMHNGSARNEDLARIEQEEEEKIEAAFDTVRGEK